MKTEWKVLAVIIGFFIGVFSVIGLESLTGYGCKCLDPNKLDLLIEECSTDEYELKMSCYDGCAYSDFIMYGQKGRIQSSQMYKDCSVKCDEVIR
jgi:hypothetical protein